MNTASNKEEENNFQNIVEDQSTIQTGNLYLPSSSYSQPNNAPQSTINVMPPSVYPRPMGPKSMEMNCPHCHCRIKTTVRHKATTKTHCACLLLSWTCCCCFLPYCMGSCQNANHFCPMCGGFIGTYAS